MVVTAVMCHAAFSAYQFSTITNSATGAKVTTTLVPDGTAVATALAVQEAIEEAVGQPKKYPLFIINLNPSELRDWKHFELKATTNNFVGADASNMLFFNASTTNGTNDEGVVVHDWARLYILSKLVDTDVRKWTRIRNTGELNGYAPTEVAVIVDPAYLFRRGQGSEWLSEANKELVWSYTRIGDTLPEKDQNGNLAWRPIMPVKWYSDIPDWADQDEVAVNNPEVREYMPPWEEDMSNLVSYRMFSGITNINHSIQYVTDSDLVLGYLRIVIPEGDGTKDWKVYAHITNPARLYLDGHYTYYCEDVSSITNVPAGMTEFHFSQIFGGRYSISKKHFPDVLHSYDY